MDAMLGNVAKKFRLFGFDCKYFAAINDDQLLSIAKSDKRILITRDHNITSVCKKQNISVIDLFDTNEAEQIIEICRQINLSKCEIDMNNTRCTICNVTIEPIEKGKIINRIPVGVAQNIQQFWICNSCNRIYWEGTHIRNLQKLISEINEKLQSY